MAKRGPMSQIGYWSRGGGGFWTTWGGEQKCLAIGPNDYPDGPTYRKAQEEFARLSARETTKGTDWFPLPDVVAEYKQKLDDNGQSSMSRNVGTLLTSFVDKYPSLPVVSLTGNHVRMWLRERTAWGSGTRRTAVQLLLGALNFAVMDGLIKTNPLAGKVEVPKPVARGRESRLPAELARLLLDASTAYFRPYLAFLHETGCRPEEAEALEAKYVFGTRVVFPWRNPGGYIHKQAKRGKEVDRTIYMSDAAAALVASLVRVHKTGPLFRSKAGMPFSGHRRVNAWIRVTSNPAVVAYLQSNRIPRKAVVPYCFRHTWASDFLDAGGSIKLCADLLGTSVSVIEKHYAHPDHDNLETVYRRFMSSRPGG